MAAVEVIPFLSGLLQRSAKDALNTKAVMELSEPALFQVNCPKFARKPFQKSVLKTVFLIENNKDHMDLMIRFESPVKMQI